MLVTPDSVDVTVSVFHKYLMNYHEIYRSLIQNAKDEEAKGTRRKGRYERHHIKPKSIGGDNTSQNLVRLTPREHFIAHLLLERMFQKGSEEHRKMAFAAWRLANGGSSARISSRTYEIVREKYVDEIREVNRLKQTGKRNSQYGRRWYTNRVDGESLKFSEAPSPDWIQGRNLFHGESSKITTVLRNRERRQIYARRIWNEYHSGSYRSIREFCRDTGNPLRYINKLLNEIPLYKQIFAARSRSPSCHELVNRFE